MVTELNADVVVIGAGIAGAAVAYELQRAGATVIVVEREASPGYHSTGRSVGVYRESAELGCLEALCRASRPFFDRPPPEFTECELLRRRGVLFPATEHQLDSLEHRWLQWRALRIERLSAAEAYELVPVLAGAAAALYEPGACDIDVHALHHGYLKGLRQAGGQVFTRAEVLALTPGRQWTIRTAGPVCRAPVVVNAAGAWADQIASLAGLPPLGLQPLRRSVIMFDPPPGSSPGSWPFVMDVAGEYYFRPDAGRLLASAADETPVDPCDARPDDLEVALAADRIQRATTLRVRRVSHKQAGLRSFFGDRLPVAGFDSRVEGLFWLAGQGGSGIKTAPALAKAAAGLVQGGGLPAELGAAGVDGAELSPDRLIGSGPNG